MKRILIAEEGVKNNRGHWTAYSRSIVDGFKQLGMSPVVAGHMEATSEVSASMPFESVFRYSRWDGLYEHRPWLERKGLVALHNWRLYRDMASYLERSEPFDLVFCGNILIYHSLAWQMLARRFLGTKIKHLALMMVQPAGSLNRETGLYEFPLRSKALAWSLARTHAFGKGRVSLSVETPAANAEFSQLTGRPVNLLHHPVEAPVLKKADGRRADTSSIRIVCPGFARYEKGSDVLLAAIRDLAHGSGSGGSLQFVMQWKKGSTFEGKAGTVFEADRELEEAGLVEFVDRELGGIDYWQFLADADLIVLPYRCDPYTSRLSRVTIEAMIMGKPIIYPKGSWLEFAVEKSGAGVGFDDGSPASLAVVIQAACSDLPSLKKQAETRAAQAAEDYSPRRFADSLSQLTENH